MSIAPKTDVCGSENPFEQITAGKRPQVPACAIAPVAVAEPKPGVFRVSADDVVKAALPRLKTFAELGIQDEFRKAVEEELTKDEKVLWLGRPSLNREVYPPKTNMVVIGVVVIALAVAFLACALLIKGIPIVFGIIFSMVLGLIGALFLAGPKLFNPATYYHACYVVTNRRAMLFERGVLGVEPGNFNFAGTRCKSYLPHDLLALERRKNAQVAGAGDLIFEYIFAVGKGAGSYPGTDGTVTSGPQRIARGFYYLDQAEEVEQLIRTTLLNNLVKKLDA
jgi:hypothetical protein